MSNWKRSSVSTLRKVARSYPAIGRVFKRAHDANPAIGRALTAAPDRRTRVVTGPGFIQRTGRGYTLISSSTGADENRVGIYLRGACDLPAMFTMAPLIRPTISGSVCIVRDPIHISGSRSDLLLHALDGNGNPPPEALIETQERLSLKPGYFTPRLFEPTFDIDGKQASATFPKSVVVLSAAPDYSRTLYRHKEHGFLVDPGGFWLNQSMEKVLGDLERVTWFKRNFASIGRLTVEEFNTSFGDLVRRIKEKTGAHVLVFGLLTIDPSEPIHSYGLAPKADTSRRREFAIALSELSAKLDFDIIDIDHILKRGGVKEQVEFGHFTEAQFAPIGAEGFRILREREIL